MEGKRGGGEGHTKEKEHLPPPLSCDKLTMSRRVFSNDHGEIRQKHVVFYVL